MQLQSQSHFTKYKHTEKKKKIFQRGKEHRLLFIPNVAYA